MHVNRGQQGYTREETDRSRHSMFIEEKKIKHIERGTPLGHISSSSLKDPEEASVDSCLQKGCH